MSINGIIADMPITSINDTNIEKIIRYVKRFFSFLEKRKLILIVFLVKVYFCFRLIDLIEDQSLA